MMHLQSFDWHNVIISCQKQNNYQYFNILLECVNIVFAWKTVDWLESVYEACQRVHINFYTQVASIREYSIINSRGYL